jgi:transposase
LNGKESGLSGKYRVFSLEFKQNVAQRILNGESVTSLHYELQIKRSVLYRWRDAYRKEGAAGLERRVGRPPGMAAARRPTVGAEATAAQRIAELERKIGQQSLDLDFLRRACKRVKESRRTSTGTGATASTERSEA